MKTLSILVPTLASRKRSLDKLMGVLSVQLTNEVEVLTESDDGSLTVGRKRNALVQRAAGNTFVSSMTTTWCRRTTFPES